MDCAEWGTAELERVFARGDEVELGQDLARCLGEAVHTEDSFWQARGDVWHSIADGAAQRLAHAYAGRKRFAKGKDGQSSEQAIMLHHKGVVGITRVAAATLGDDAFFSSAPHGAAFGSEFARCGATGVEYEPLTSAHRVKVQHRQPFALPDPWLRPERVDQLLAETWAGCYDRDERIAYFWEWLGAAILGISQRYKASPLLVGAKDTGKSRVLQVVEVCFPADAVQSIALHDLANEYYRARLSGARLNVVNELPARELLDGESAKAILSGDPVSCRHPAGRPFSWRSRCAQIYAANGLPPSLDNALMMRFVVLDCPNVVPHSHQDHGLPAAIAAEAPLIASTALQAASALLARGHFQLPSSTEKAADQWQIESNPVAAWKSENTAPDSIGEGLDALYGNFREWAAANGHHVLSKQRFANRLGGLGVSKRHDKDGNAWLLSTARATVAAAKAWSR